jgi:hypothetical protein
VRYCYNPTTVDRGGALGCGDLRHNAVFGIGGATRTGLDLFKIQLSHNLRNCNMDISRRLGILVFMGVPAIIGGGIVYAIFGSLTPMWIYEALLLLAAGAFVSR